MSQQAQKNSRNKRQKPSQNIFRRLFNRFVRIRGNPREIALGFALGVFIGMTPSMGFQMLIVVFIAALLKWNKISSVLGVQITNPLTAPFIYSITYATGAKILGYEKIRQIDFSIASIGALLQKAPKILTAMSLGGFVLGLPLAVFAYFIALGLIRKYQEPVKKKLAQQKEKLAITKEKIKKRVRRKKKRKRRKNRKE